MANNRLPYTENLVNLIVLKDFNVPVRDMLRVLTPGGSAIAKKASVAESFSSRTHLPRSELVVHT